jgi:hypothetical protein
MSGIRKINNSYNYSDVGGDNDDDFENKLFVENSD